MIRLGRRKLVRLHLFDNQPSVEGIYVGRYDGHYRLLRPSMLEAEERTHELDGEVWVPRERVLLIQVIG